MSAAPVPDFLKKRLSEIPDKPGVYLFRDRDGMPVYIGKALSLKKRVAGHLRSYGETATKEGLILRMIARIDVIETPTEAEALLLESSLVKENLPKYNKMLRDDKSYPYLKITAEEYPRLLVVRNRKADGSKYFGPYTDVRLLRQAVKMLRREFPLRTCRKMPAKVCLMYHIGQCGGPCERKQDSETYRRIAAELERFLEGRRDSLVKHLSKRMKEHAARHEFEKAKSLLESIRALSSVPVRKTSASRKPAEVLADFQALFSLPGPPRRLECFDISNIHGQEAVGSMVVFLEGRPARSEYRRFRVRNVKGIDDYKMIREVVGRRYARLLNENTPLPDLIVIDGGKGHLASAKAELDALGLERQPVISIAKQKEILFSPGREAAHVLPPTSPVLHMIRHLRDEAHRFAISYHRRLHRKAALVSRLDGIPGLGPKGKEMLLRKFGSFVKIESASESELAAKGALRPSLAESVWKALHPLKGEVAG